MKQRGLQPYHGIIGAALVFLMLIFGGPLFGKLGVYGSLLGEVLIPLIGLVLLLLARGDIRDTFPMKLPPVKAFFGAIGMYIGVVALNGAIGLLTSRLIPDYSARGDSVNAMVLAMSPVLAILIVAVAPAICEELFCRGFLLSSFRPIKKPVLSIVLVAVLFGAMHLDLYSFLPTALLGGLFAFIAWKTESLILPMLLHFFNNALSVLVAYFVDGDAEAAVGSLDSMPVAQTVGYFLFYLGIAFAFLFFSGKWFLGKKFRLKSSVAAFSAAAVLVTGGYGTILVTAFGHPVLMKVETVAYQGSLEKAYELSLEEGDYAFQVTAVAENSLKILLEKDGETVLESPTAGSPQISDLKTASLVETARLEAGDYRLVIKTVTASPQEESKSASITAIVRKQG